MKSTRGAIACALVAAILVGPFSAAFAQQPTAPAAQPTAPAMQPAAPPAVPPAAPPAPVVPAAPAVVVPTAPAVVVPATPAPPPPPGVVVEVVTPEPTPPAVGRDIYDVAAGVATVVRAPLVAGLCGLGAIAGTVLFLGTFGTSYKGSTRAFEEGCGQKWIVTGDDLRPRGAPGIFFDRPDASRSRW